MKKIMLYTGHPDGGCVDVGMLQLDSMHEILPTPPDLDEAINLLKENPAMFGVVRWMMRVREASKTT
jgi:hypothetical protein